MNDARPITIQSGLLKIFELVAYNRIGDLEDILESKAHIGFKEYRGQFNKNTIKS